MKHPENIDPKNYLSDLLKKGHKGTADELAQKSGISRRTFFRYIEEFRDLGADIQFCKTTYRYRLLNEFDYMKALFENYL